MRHLRRVLTLTATLVVAFAAFAVSAAPAQAISDDPGEPSGGPPPCGWIEWGTNSICDGEDPLGKLHASRCESFSETIELKRITGPSGETLAWISLDYIRGKRTLEYPGGICRVAYATISGLHESAENCYVKVERNSDGQAYRVSGNTYRGDAWTQAVYDAGVTSYAWGYCSFMGAGYSARTANY